MYTPKDYDVAKIMDEIVDLAEQHRSRAFTGSRSCRFASRSPPLASASHRLAARTTHQSHDVGERLRAATQDNVPLSSMTIAGLGNENVVEKGTK